ncbi:hypothetical protein HMPREF1144_2521 [Klebsiella sp. OBRC7]|nr:hypothetical protein HMPREF1144_2521 [Klebsiella sp. OBRC7]
MHTIFLFCLVVVMFYLFLPVIHRSRDADRGYGFVCSVARTDAQHRLRDILQHPAAFPRGGAMRLARATNAAGDENRSPDKALTAAIRGQT